MGYFLSVIESIAAGVRRRRIERDIEKNNDYRRGINEYNPSDIEAFIERQKTLGSYVISGETEIIRHKAISAVIVKALNSGVSTILLHEDDSDLINYISYILQSTGNKKFISSQRPVYDPFYNRDYQGIGNLVISASSGNASIGNQGGLYLSGITKYITALGVSPYVYLYLECPYDQLLNKIDSKNASGQIPDSRATEIRSLLSQGQNERANVQGFFSRLEQQGKSVLLKKQLWQDAANIKAAVNRGAFLSIDIGSSTNDLLINLIVQEIKEQISERKKLMLIIDSISLSANEQLCGLLHSQSPHCQTVLSSKDVYSMVGSDEKLFNTITSNANMCIVLKHTYGASCEAWSKAFGDYDYNKVTHNDGNVQNYGQGYGYLDQSAISVAIEREAKVKPEVIKKMEPIEAYILDRDSGEEIHTLLN